VSDIPIRDVLSNRVSEILLPGKGLGDLEAQLLASLLRKTESVKTVHVENNSFRSIEVAQSLASALLASGSVETFNQFPVADLLSGRQRSLKLSYAEPPLEDFDIAILAPILAKSRVQWLDVSHNAIGLEGFRNLAASLEHLKLENLAVQGNGELTHETYVDLLGVLERAQLNRSARVDLWGQLIPTTQLSVLRRLLLNDLRARVIPSEDIDSIAQALSVVDVREMSLQGCALSKRDAMVLLEAVGQMPEFHLELGGLPLTPPDCRVALGVLKASTSDTVDYLRLASAIGSRHGRNEDSPTKSLKA
jgi:hypothetical protein